MTFSINIKKKPLEIKFNYGLFFKANKKLGTKDKDGNYMNNGAGILFSKILENDDEAIVNIIQLASKEKYSENEIFEGIEEFVEAAGETEEAGYDALFDEMKKEMLASGFFKKKILKYIEQMEKAKEVLSKKKDDESKVQVEAIEELIEKMKKEL